MDRHPDPIQTLRYAQTCSSISRDQLFLNLMARDQELGKQIAFLTEQRIEIVALIRAIQWLREPEKSDEPLTPRKSERPLLSRSSGKD